jgi:hypothetical protein
MAFSLVLTRVSLLDNIENSRVKIRMLVQGNYGMA